MAKTISVSNEVHAEIKKLGTFKDTYDSILRRVFKLSPKVRKRWPNEKPKVGK